MMKPLLLSSLLLGAAACTDMQAEWDNVTRAFHPDTRIVQVSGRNWAVSPGYAGRPETWLAARFDDLHPYGRPGQPRTPEGKRALELGSGCQVVPGTLFQNTAADFYADMACP